MRKTWCLLAVAAMAAFPAGKGRAEPAFRDLSDRLPVRHEYQGDWPFFVGGGVAVLDCDANGFPDLYAAGGSGPAHLFVNRTPGAAEVLRFDLASSPVTDLTDVTGAYPLDIDGDGVLDLFVLRDGPNAALRGLGGCRFENAEDRWDIAPGDEWTTAFSAAWGPGALWPTLAVGNYVDRDDPDGPFGTCAEHRLFRPQGAGYAAAQPLGPGHCALSMLFTDWSGTGQQDLWISNDRHYYLNSGQEQLFHLWPDLHEYAENEGWQRQMLWGMGIASRDITGDGRPEIAVTSMADQKLFQLESGTGAGPHFHSIAHERGTTAQVPYMGDEGRPSTGWHVQFGDVDNDGRDDLFIAKGNVSQMPGIAMRDPDNLLMQKPDGHFTEMGDVAGVGSDEHSRGGALIDLNRDGLQDLVVVQRRAPLKLYQNVTAGAGNWLKLRLTQPTGNRNAIGARIEVRSGGKIQYREVQSGGGHAGGQADYEHFGLGPAGEAEIRVRWPDGQASPWSRVAANQHLVLGRDTGLSVGGAAEAEPPERQ